VAKYLLLLAALLCAGMANADNSKANAPTVVDADGFKEPLTKLKFNPGLDQREFERSTLNALNVYDPLESWNRRVYHFNYRFDQWVFLPVVDGYRYVTPSFLRTGVSNFFNNLGDVPNLFNSLLQLKGQRSGNHRAPAAQHHHRHRRPVGPGDRHGPAAPERRLRPDPGLLWRAGVPGAADSRPVEPARHRRAGGGLQCGKRRSTSSTWPKSAPTTRKSGPCAPSTSVTRPASAMAN
jgi:hypothetical protein